MPENARTPSKFAQIAPIQSANHTPRQDQVIESKLNLKPGALASEEKFPTLEVLAEEKGIEIEQPAEASPDNKPAEDVSAPAAWQGKLPEAVKQDGEFTEAEINFIDEPAERAAQAEKEKEEKAKLAKEKEAKKQEASESFSAKPQSEVKVKKLDTDRKQEKKEGSHSIAEPKKQEAPKIAPASTKDTIINLKKNGEPEIPKLHLEDVLSTEKPINEQGQVFQKKDSILKDSEVIPTKQVAKPIPKEKPLAKEISKLEFPPLGVLGGKKEEIQKKSNRSEKKDEEASAPAAWQGKLPEAVKQDGEFTKAEINFIDEPAERAAKAAKAKEEKKERKIAAKTGLLRWFKGEPRETGLEKAFVRAMAGFLGLGLMLVGGILRFISLQKFTDRIVNRFVSLSDGIIKSTYGQSISRFLNQWWACRLVARIAQNINGGAQTYLRSNKGDEGKMKERE